MRLEGASQSQKTIFKHLDFDQNHNPGLDIILYKNNLYDMNKSLDGFNVDNICYDDFGDDIINQSDGVDDLPLLALIVISTLSFGYFYCSFGTRRSHRFIKIS